MRLSEGIAATADLICSILTRYILGQVTPRRQRSPPRCRGNTRTLYRLSAWKPQHVAGSDRHTPFARVCLLLAVELLRLHGG